MNDTIHLLAMSGSLRAESFSHRLLVGALTRLPAHVEVASWRGQADLPAFNEDLEAGPRFAAVDALLSMMRAADVVLVSTPEYNGSVPGALKNALDWASRPFLSNPLRDTPVAVIGASPSPGGAGQAVAHLRLILARTGAHVIGESFALPRVHQSLSPSGLPIDPARGRDLDELLAELVASAPPALRGADLVSAGSR